MPGDGGGAASAERKTRLRLACVVHRFGVDIAGGSEGHCRAIAARLAAHHDVTVLTTTASDHVTWSNTFPPGAADVAGLRVIRFPVVRQRSLHDFAILSDRVFGGGAPRDVQRAWFEANGPQAPALIEYLQVHGADFDYVLFWSFRYYQSFFGVPVVGRRAVLVPTAEEDPAIRIELLGEFFAQPAGLVYLTPEEQTLVEGRIRGARPPSCVIGCGLDPAPDHVPAAALATVGVEVPYALYLGRVDPNKGCEHLLRFFPRWSERTGRPLRLVLAGPPNMPIPAHPAVQPLGYVAADVREALLAHAAALIVPSPFESLSMVLLEAWNHGVPALVNARCRVLAGQVRRAGGGLAYRNYDEFAAALTRLVDNPRLSRALGEAGRAYVEQTYRWPQVMATLERFLATLPAVTHT